jgi:DNA-binding HxlR family transcriptional regulator
LPDIAEDAGAGVFTMVEWVFTMRWNRCSRWAGARNLSAQPRRFSELRIDIPGISARVLSARLRELVAKGVVTRSVLPTSPPSVEYALTDLGRELVPAIAAIVKVGHRLRRPAAT